MNPPALEVVRGSVRSRAAVRTGSVDAVSVEVAGPHDHGPPGRLAARWAVLAIALLTGLLVVPDPLPFGVAIVAATLIIGLQRIAARSSFGFGDGFLTFRPDLGWPAGVQEDDDVRWAWTPASEARPR